jgi:polyphosphate kinase 2 (PPK2 family)
MERVVEIVEKTDDKEAINHCKMLLNMLEHDLICTMKHYIHEYEENQERNYGYKLD